MDFDQIIKRLDWLDEEHRKDKATIADLNQQIDNLGGDLKAATKKIKELTTQVTKLSTVKARIDQFDEALIQQRTDIFSHLDGLDTKRQENLAEVDKRYQLQFTGINKSLTEIRKLKEPITGLKQELKASVEEETRLAKLMANWDVRLQDMTQTVAGVQRTLKAAEEPRRQDAKRLADLQGELSCRPKTPG